MNATTRFLEQSPPTLVWLAHATVGSSILILVVLAIRMLFGRRLPVGILSAGGGIILFRLALPFTPESPHSVYSNPLASSPVFTPERIDPVAPLPISATSWHGLEESGPVSSVPAAMKPASAFEAEPAGFVPSRPARAIALPIVIHRVWLAGLLIFLGVGGARYWRLRRWARCQPKCTTPSVLDLAAEGRSLLGLRRNPRIRSVDRLRSAAVIGIFAPEILLPDRLIATLSRTDLRHVILHELAHIRRRDSLLSIVAHLVRALHWFNPLVWITVRHFMADREVLCDEAVLRHLGRRERRRYGETLLRVLRLAPPPHPAGATLIPFLSNKPEIKRRLTMIAKNRTPRSLPGALGATSALALLAFTLAAAPAQDRDSKSERDKPEARERDPEREKPEARERDAEREKPEARERDPEREKPEARERDAEREKPEARERERAELNRRREQEIQAVREQIGRLAREGKHEEAERLEQRLRLKLQAEGRVPERPVEARPGNPEDLRRHIAELTEVVRQMQRSMNEMREELHLLRESQNKGRDER